MSPDDMNKFAALLAALAFGAAFFTLLMLFDPWVPLAFAVVTLTFSSLTLVGLAAQQREENKDE